MKVKAKDILQGRPFATLECPWCQGGQFDMVYGGWQCIRCGQVVEIDDSVSWWKQVLGFLYWVMG